MENLLNTNGPYDGRVRSLHLSLAASLVASSAGVPVIMHSSDDLPPKKGVTTAHVLEALGIPAFLEPETVEKRIETHGFGFLHAYRYNFGVERMRPIREKLIYRSFIHTSEVLSNPGNAKLSMVGAAHDTFLDRFADVQSGMGTEHVLVVQGLDGGDELPLKAITGIEVKDGHKDKIILDPENYGISHMQHTPVKSAEETADIIFSAFAGKESEHTPAIAYNAGVRIYLGRRAKNIQEGVETARELLASGAALKKLESLMGRGS